MYDNRGNQGTRELRTVLNNTLKTKLKIQMQIYFSILKKTQKLNYCNTF